MLGDLIPGEGYGGIRGDVLVKPKDLVAPRAESE